MPSALWKDFRKAKKEHRCCECRGIISINESYNRYRGIWDGEPGHFKECLDCSYLRDEINANIQDYEERVYFTGLGEYVCEMQDKSFALKYLNIIKRRKSNSKTDWLERIINNSED